MKKFLALFVAVLMIIALVPTVALALPGVSLTGGGDSTADYNASSVFIAPSIEVNSSGNLEGTSIVVTDLPEDCTIGHTDTPTGITVTVQEDNKVIRLTGSASAADYQQALRGIYVNTGTTAATVKFDIAIGAGNILYNSANQHFYKYVNGSLTWQDAKNFTDASNHFGLQGYLATITSKKENDFVSKLCGGQGWLGASDVDIEDTWKWVTGPEEDTIIVQYGFINPAEYSNWQTGQPDNNGDEDYMYMMSNGQWCDLDNADASANGYVVEYGGISGDPVVDVSETCRLTITAPYNASSVLIAPTIELNLDNRFPLQAATIAVTGLPEDCTIGHIDMPAGITVTVREDNKIIRLSGFASVASYQQALRSIYINTGTTNGTVTFDIAPGYAVYNKSNQHYYEYVLASRSWQDARNEAQSKDYFGLQGYLATITSKNENDFVATYCGGQGWIGGSDEDTENTWKWVTGPEAGTMFWRDGYKISGQYSNFLLGEPNDFGSGEDYMHIYGYDPDTSADIFGQWCDFYKTNPSIKGYVVEYGGSATDPEVYVGQAYQLTIVPSKHTVSFNSHGASAVNSISDVIYGSMISKPNAPTRTGYDFAEWYKTTAYNTQWNFSTDTVSSDFTLHAKWTPRNDTQYVIEHYKQDADGEGYTLVDTDNLTGTSGETATAVQKKYTGFTENTTHAQRVASGTIMGDGSLVLKLYYDREDFTITYDNNTGIGTASEKQDKGATFTLHSGEGFSKDDYVIEGWTIDGTKYKLGALYTMPSSDVTAEAIWAEDGDNDGISDDDETSAGTDPNDEDNTPNLGTVRVTVLGSDGEAEAGLTCVLNSQPVTAVTDANGVAVFNNVALAPHTLSVRSSTTQLGTYSIDFSKGSENGTKISDSGSTDSLGGVTATVTSTFLTLDLTIKQSSDNQWAIDDSSHTEQIPNPATGYSDFAWLWVCTAAVLLAGSALAIKRRLTQK